MSVSSPEQDAPAHPAADGSSAARGKPDIAHVGYHRTGTNFLQNEVFPRLAAHLFRPERSGWQYFDDPAGFDGTAARDFFQGEQAKNVEGKPFLISHERLTGTAERDDLSVAGKLHALNPDMKVIVVIRSQYGMFRSLYHLHVKRGGAERYGAFIQRLIAGRRCDYRAMIGRYAELFGQDRVLTLLYEDLATEPRRFLKELCNFIDLPLVAAETRPINARGSDSGLQVRRFLNEKLAVDRAPAAWKASLIQSLQGLALKADRMNEELRGGPILAIDTDSERQVIRDAYALGNCQLAELIGRPLGDCGYPV